MNSTDARVSTWAPIAVSITSMLIFATAIIFAWMPHEASPALDILFGAAAANATSVVGFWVGSSAGSREKDKTIAANTPGGTTP
jgi:hypothetical protein